MGSSRYRSLIVSVDIHVNSDEGHWHSPEEALAHVDALFDAQAGAVVDGWWPMQILSAGWKNGAGL
jgi:hypothetical protein